VLKSWEAQRPHPVEIKPKGDSITQEFYTKHVLPTHIEHVKWLEAHIKHKIYFQEDNDPSHGTRSSFNVARVAKRDAHLTLFTHPPQSPDLNPIEGIWQIIKQRLRGGRWNTVVEFKEAIVREYRRVKQSEIRKRISEMHTRCRAMIEAEGKRYRSKLW
jgi:transposase